MQMEWATEGEMLLSAASAGAVKLQIRLFGTPEILCCGAPLPRLHSRRALWLLAILALKPGAAIERSRLAGMLWPDSPDTTALHNLRQTASDLRRALGDAADAIASTSARKLSLDLTLTDVDVVAFDTAVTGDSAGLRKAIDLYKGPLLEGCDEPWAVEARDARQELYLGALERLGEECFEGGDPSGAVRYLRLALGTDPYRESMCRTLMKALADCGELAAATEVFRDLRIRLNRDLNTAPDPSTVAAYRALRNTREPKMSSPQIPRPAVHTGRLPAPRTQLIGRDGAISEVARMLQRSRLVTLSGIGGIGKTSLALQVANDLEIQFEHGAVFANLSQLTDPAAVPDAVRELAGVISPQGSLDDLAILQSQLASRRMLLVIDNCEHVLQACASLADALLTACPDLVILATSRHALGLRDEIVWRVPPLSIPDAGHGPSALEDAAKLMEYPATRLFITRAMQASSTFTVSAGSAICILQICRRLEGLPLAIELAAARVTVLTVEQIAQRLDRALLLLTQGDPTVPERHQTLRALIDWSYDLLDDKERALLRGLSVFAGACSLESVTKVIDIDEFEAIELLASLVAKSLVSMQSGSSNTARYRLLDTIRQYASEQLDRSGEGALRSHTHALCFRALAVEARNLVNGPDSSVCLELLPEDHNNFRAALEWARTEGGDRDTGLEIAEGLWRFWNIRGYFKEGRAWLAEFTAHECRPDLRSIRARALNGAGVIAEVQGDYLTARELHLKSLAISRELGDPICIAASLHNLATITIYLGDSSNAGELLEESLALRRETGDERGIAGSLGHLGLLAHGKGDFDTAATLFQESLEIFRRLGDHRWMASVLNNLGGVEFERGNTLTADDLFEECVEITRRLGDRRATAVALTNLASTARKRGDLRTALSCSVESLEISDEIGCRPSVADALNGLAALAAAVSNHLLAARLWSAASEVRSEIGAAMESAEQRRHDDTIAASRCANADNASFDRAWREGARMTAGEALAYASEIEKQLAAGYLLLVSGS